MNNTTALHPLKLDALRIKQPLPVDIWSANGLLLLAKGQMVNRAEQLQRLAEHQPSVRESDLQKLQSGDFASEWLRLSVLRTSAGEKRRVTHERSTHLAPSEAWLDLHTRLNLLLRRWDSTNWVFIDGIRCVATQVAEMMVHRTDESLFVLMQMLQDRQVSYSAAHALMCAALCHLIAPSAGLQTSEIDSLVHAALTMNLGMSRLHDQLAQQRQPVDEIQRVSIQAHPSESANRLRALGVQDRIWLDLVLFHHDETGLTAPNHPSPAFQTALCLLHMVDLFAARVSPRKTRRGLLPNQALRSVFVQSQATSSTLGQLLVKSLGLYPPGSYVRLKSGEIAVVLRRGRRANTPAALAIVNSQGMPLSVPAFRDTEFGDHAVLESVNADDVRVRLDPVQILKRS